MRELKEVIERQADGHLDGDELRGAAQKWASFALGLFVGDLLSKALDVSCALADFSAELDGKEGEDGN